MSEKTALSAIVHGRVQGVYFRAFVQQKAHDLGLEGYVRNLPGGGLVEVHAEGERHKLEELSGFLHVGPMGARVDRVDTKWVNYSGDFTDFQIRY